MQSNPSLIKLSSANAYRRDLSGDTLSLPFFDDFSGNSIVPDGKKWSDNEVFINNTFTDKQITSGVATFDAIDNTGRLYETASPELFEADHLTSQPIDLDLHASDNVWLSFYYQPGGLGDIPEESDSLILQFYAPDENMWYHAWSTPGNDYPDFKLVMIRIDGDRFLKKGFRLRFANYVSLSSDILDPSLVSNCDQWNIDYVLIDRNRNANDTVFKDVAFRYPLRSLLKDYESMPWKQFFQVYLQEMGSFIPIHYRNNDIITRNVTRDFQIYDVYKDSVVKSFSAGATNIAPMTNVDYDATHVYTYNTDLEDSALFRVKAWLITDEFDPKQNDTLIYYQKFGNYFAYDDGTAEGGYGINGLGSGNAMVACRFRSYIQDTVRAISICFNDSYLNANRRTFDLMVWDDDNGMPGNVIGSREQVIVEQGNTINGFYTYKLPGGIAVDGIFYIGWKQRSETFLNVGYDVNTPNDEKQLYWINGDWNRSAETGTIMIRPVTGASLPTAVQDVRYDLNTHLHIRPNPAGQIIYLDPVDITSGQVYISFIDMQGKMQLKVPYSESVNISALHPGVYIVMEILNGKPVGYTRLVKIK